MLNEKEVGHQSVDSGEGEAQVKARACDLGNRKRRRAESFRDRTERDRETEKGQRKMEDKPDPCDLK